MWVVRRVVIGVGLLVALIATTGAALVLHRGVTREARFLASSEAADCARDTIESPDARSIRLKRAAYEACLSDMRELR